MQTAKRKKALTRRKLRQNSTDAEMKLWLALRARRLGGFKFVRRAKVGRYIVDFICREKYLAVEVDGGQHGDNQKDRLLDAELMSRGYIVLRFWNNDVLQNFDGVLQKMYEALCAR